tara:strand:+ start:108 stop:1064 length:957 start_codon:yes stop_codon:yes gene_type:complete
MENIQKYADNLTNFFQKRHNIQNKPSINFQKDAQNGQNPLGKTAYYDPEGQSITIYVTGRHVKDCLRSVAHELVHHLQNERGDLANAGPTTPGYAQEDGHMREMEREAYETGNMCFRDWEDNLKTTNKQLYETIYKTNIKGDAKMSIKEWKNQEMSEILMEKWGFTPKEGSFLTEGMASYDLSNSDYATGEIEETPENLEEEELGEDTHPQSAASKQEVLDEKEELEEEKHWGKGKHEYKREEEDGVEHKAGDVDGHYKDYEVKYGGNKGEKSATDPGEEDYTTKKGMKKKTGPGKAYMNEERLRETIKSVIKELAAE